MLAELRGATRLLAVRLDNVGDVVMLGPALRALRAALPQTHITLLASPAGAQVAPLLPWVDEVVGRRVVWQDASHSMPQDPSRETELVAELARAGYDAAFIFTSFSQSPHTPGYVCYLAGIPVRVGESKEFGGSVLSHQFPAPPDETHQVERNLRLVEACGLPAAGGHLELHPSAEARASADALLAVSGLSPDEPFVAVAPGASCPARTYEPSRMREVVRQLAQRADLPVVVLGSKRDAPIAEIVLSDTDPGRVKPLVGRTTIPELAAVLSRARLLVANDSGPMHIADAFARPMVILFSGTDLEEQWRPRAGPAALLRRPTFCSPCYLFECAYQMECLDIPPEEVVDRGVALLTQAGATSDVAV